MPDQTGLGRLTQVDLRDFWRREDTDFTPWLSQDENISLLGEALGLRLVVEETEANVGPFRADILCSEVGEIGYVLIENQLERTDHTHLGQILTYSAGLNAVKIVWIARDFTDEHRATLDWLNRITNEEFRFFGVQVELWKIGNSRPAPKFDVVAKPNDWTKQIVGARTTREGGWYGRVDDYKSLWQSLSDYIARSGRDLTPPKSSGLNWTRIDIGVSGVRLVYSYSFSIAKMKIFILFDDKDVDREDQALERHRLVLEHATDIGQALSDPISWHESTSWGGGYGQIERTVESPDLGPESLFEWAVDCAAALQTTLGDVLADFE